jgi:anaerobic selenocysteine-containing dehydrogenase
MTAPDMRGRLRRLRQRGGKVVVIDPYRTRTAQEADEHHFIKPGHDAYFLFALVHTLFAEGLVAPGKLVEHIAGLEKVCEMAEPFTPERVATICGIDASTIRAIARELAAAPRAAVYGRIGTCTQEFGTLSSWLVDVLNVLTGKGERCSPKLLQGHAIRQVHPVMDAACVSDDGRAACAGNLKSMANYLLLAWPKRLTHPDEGR